MTTKMPAARKQGSLTWALCLCAAVCLILLSYRTPLARTLVIEGVEEAPLKWLGHEEAMGIDVDIMTEVLTTMGVSDYVFRFVDTGSRLLHNAKSGNSDIILTLSMNDRRTKYLMYPDEAHLLLDWRFAVRAEDKNKIRFDDFTDLERLRIGAAADYSYTSSFWNSGLDIQTVARSDLLIPMLLQKRFDVVPVNYLNTIYHSLQNRYRDRVAFLYPPLRRAPYYNVFSRASDYPGKEAFLEEYDKIIREMRDDGRLLRIFERYLGPDGYDWWQSQYSQ
ncbi:MULTISPECIES: ABC transporter substrate-binding protein [Thalassospira]|uniref:Amino acid ABC transporter substrate-binding protein n=1 Tax=Thalassospira profundimaris TaxID=502049 RepID=A0A367VA91_9PROT|nr:MULTISPECIES: ABC transporter substrate-binding protein [Thalassospira]KZB72123.1 amino acid ABC transporter substrate-binding protein [Thalassospira sp. MCCC 1A01148]RCK22107.1 amino acid ABC transporter substrate-binding protein [Thalassospira profundimaris]